jgi:hypothetical protein
MFCIYNFERLPETTLCMIQLILFQMGPCQIVKIVYFSRFISDTAQD